ncbi:MAG: pyrimidine dimer DNA glycosylase/endonuclease V [Candidatus Kapabacteria bacterium]|jgi:hypothetical protein|nr:pyrimidine dimer DNA glycosylase/endonuclease V [Candidatus Kapabacteria bacterium]
MRIWSLHPSLLDTKGLVALWRETLLAKHVLEGKTKGYTNHPQLNRFKATENPIFAINYYLSEIQKEAEKRGYNFDKNKIDWNFQPISIDVNDKQVAYEFEHLLKKLKIRDFQKFESLKNVKKIELHKMFKEVKGEIEDWEVVI